VRAGGDVCEREALHAQVRENRTSECNFHAIFGLNSHSPGPMSLLEDKHPLSLVECPRARRNAFKKTPRTPLARTAHLNVELERGLGGRWEGNTSREGTHERAGRESDASARAGAAKRAPPPDARRRGAILPIFQKRAQTARPK